MSIEPRIAIFDDWMPLLYRSEIEGPDKDLPDDWAKSLGKFKFRFQHESNGTNYYTVWDDRLIRELNRLTKFKTCPICRDKTAEIETHIEEENVQICLTCGYWGGIGFRDWNSHLHAGPRRGVIGRYSAIKPLDSASSDYLVSHFKKHPDSLTKISPKRSEKFVMDLLSDCLDCEVRTLGGVKDGGVDGYILRGDSISSIIQVKWHETINKAESVRVVREVAGTLLARRVPNGIIVSNRAKFSKPAEEEAHLISQNHVDGIGKISLSLLDYHNILDMLEISNTKISNNMKIDDWFKVPSGLCVFDGAAMIHENLVNIYSE